MRDTLTEIIERVRGDRKARDTICPAHEDRRASLSVGIGDDGRILLHCQAGCAFDDVFTATGLDRKDLRPPQVNGTVRASIDRTYDYQDEHGGLVYQVCRMVPKTFKQRRPDGAGGWIWNLSGVRRVVYRLPHLKGQSMVFVPEGEKDCDRLVAIGVAATTSAGGAGKWRDDYATQLASAGVGAVIVLPDHDEPGAVHAATVARSCHAAGLAVTIVNLPGLAAKGDVSDWLDAGHTRDELLALVDATVAYGHESGDSDVEPSMRSITPPDLAGLLTAIQTFIRKFVVLTPHQVAVVTLWIAHTHAIAAADCTPYLQVTSATKRAGKTRLLEVLEPLVARPWLTGRMSAAVLVRKTDAESPTLLLDESDAAFNGERDYAEALRSILNSGYRRSGTASLCIGQGANISYKDFHTFGAKAIAGIGTLPDTVADRALPIQLRRRKSDEPCSRWRARAGHADAAPLFDGLRAWAAEKSVIERLRQAEPASPPIDDDRKIDVLEPLLAIADLAGETWGTQARASAVALVGTIDDADIVVELLADIADLLPALAPGEYIATKDLIAGLVALDDRPWPVWGKAQQKGISGSALARLLGPLDIHPRSFGSGRGYRRDAFDDAIARYVPSKVSKRQDINNDGPES